jgi:hypothetical protein
MAVTKFQTWHAASESREHMTATTSMKSTSLKPTRSRRDATPTGGHHAYSKNPIINRFLQLTVEEGRSIRGVSLCYCTSSSRQVVFSFADGSDQKLVSESDNSAFNEWWKDACDVLKRLRGVHFSPAL